MRKPSPGSCPNLVSVVMPVRNGAEHIEDQLTALASQTYTGPWELIVVDNGCSDQTIDIVREFSPRLPRVTIADARARRGLNRARNVGAATARGDFLVFCDADDVASLGWLEAMTEAACNADIVGGRLEWETLNDSVVRAWRPQAPMDDLVADHGFLRYAPGGNLGVWAAVAREVGWDEEFSFGSSDHGFSWRAQLAGYRLAFAPEAVMRQRFRRTLWTLARQQFRYGRSGAQLQRKYSSIGAPGPDNREALRIWRNLLRTVPHLWGSRGLRGHWIQLAAFRLGRLVGSVRERTLCL
jgi:glycosyltransferase involved in cell wall biosynthesis